MSRSIQPPLLLALLALLVAVPATGDAIAPRSLEFIGRAALPLGTEFRGERVGGLSGLAWDAGAQRLLALSDDPSEHAPARYYELEITLDDGRLDDGDWRVVDRHQLRQRGGQLYGHWGIDPEGIAIAPDGSLFLSTEGSAAQLIDPFVARIDRDGRVLEQLKVDRRFRPNRSGRRGVRQNLGFESLTVTPSGRFLFAATENALVGDGPGAAPGVGSLSRLVAWSLDGSRERRELVYAVEPILGMPPNERAHRVNGLVDLLALSDTRLLALEREYVEDVGLRLSLYLVELTGATNVAGIGGLADRADIGPVRKSLLIDFASIGVPLANFEGMAIGPLLPDGRRSLLVVVDDNFDPEQSPTLLIGFALDDRPLTIADLQGAAHRSPFEGQWVSDIEGVVTAVDARSRPPAFFLESAMPDADGRTSEGVRVTVAHGRLPEIGTRLRVGGRVEERAANAKQLPVTTLALAAMESVEGSIALPAPVRLFRDLAVPPQIEGDRLTDFRPERDAIDLWESLEGMRVELPAGVASGPSLRFGEFVLLPDGTASQPRSSAGGELLSPDGPSMDRVFVSGRMSGGLPAIAVGDRIGGPIQGVVDYSFSNYKVVTTTPVERSGRGASCSGQTRLGAAPGTLTIGTANLENLSAVDPPERFALAGRVLAVELASPAIVALEEVVDDSGKARGDGVVSAERTLTLLVDAVVAAGGPRYEWVSIDPELDREGGVPGGNIRVALLFDPARVQLSRRGEAGPQDATEPAQRGDAVALDPNPGRVDPGSPAFTMASGEGVRRSLAVEFTVAGRPLFVVANHWSSKYDDDRSFGAVQPPSRPTGAKRVAQSEVVRAWVERLLELDPDARAVILGDLNDLPWSDAVRWISRPPLSNLNLEIPIESRYTYNFEGAAQTIDYLLVTPALAAGAEIEAVHRNSDCPDEVRSSDHDPLVARVRID